MGNFLIPDHMVNFRCNASDSYLRKIILEKLYGIEFDKKAYVDGAEQIYVNMQSSSHKITGVLWKTHQHTVSPLVLDSGSSEFHHYAAETIPDSGYKEYLFCCFLSMSAI